MHNINDRRRGARATGGSNRKYGEALKYVPKWAALEEARDAAAKQKT
jgi:hypothetical protein